jgi:hypothetical protein
MSLSLKQAIVAAREHFQVLLPEFAKSGEIKEDEVRLEEIEKDGENWLVTLSIPYRENSTLGSYLRQTSSESLIGFERLAKIIIVDGKNGNLVALKQHAA